MQAIQETVPISLTMEESISSLRAWSALRARPASSNQRARTTAVLREREGRQETSVRTLMEALEAAVDEDVAEADAPAVEQQS